MQGFSNLFGDAPQEPRRRPKAAQKKPRRLALRASDEARYGEDSEPQIGRTSFGQEKVGRIMSFFNSQGLREKSAAPGWALRVFKTDLHRSYVPNCTSSGELPQSQRTNNAKDALEKDRVLLNGNLKEMAKSHFDSLKNPLDNVQEQRSLELLFAPMTDFRDIMPKDLIDEALAELQNLVEENKRRQQAALDLARSVVTIGGMTLRPAVVHEEDNHHPTATANFTTAQRIDLQSFFQRYTLRASANNIDCMYRSTWFRILADMKLLGPGLITFSRAKDVFHMFSESQTTPVLTFASWLNALQYVLKVKTLYPTQSGLCKALFTKLLKRCEHRLPDPAANRDDQHSSPRQGSKMSQRLKTEDKSNESWCFNLAEEQICEPEVIGMVEEFKNLFRTIYDLYAVNIPAEDSMQPYPGKDRATPANPTGFASNGDLAIITNKFETVRLSRRNSKEPVPPPDAVTMLPGELNREPDLPLPFESAESAHVSRRGTKDLSRRGTKDSIIVSQTAEASPSGRQSQFTGSTLNVPVDIRNTQKGMSSGHQSNRQSRRSSRTPTNRAMTMPTHQYGSGSGVHKYGSGSGSGGPSPSQSRRASRERADPKESWTCDVRPAMLDADKLADLEQAVEEPWSGSMNPSVNEGHATPTNQVHAKGEKHGIDWTRLYEELPFQKERLRERQKLFTKIDLHCNGSLSLVELETHLCEAIPDLFRCKAVIARAFHLARNYAHDSSDSDWSVEKREFRILLEYLYHFLHLWVIFERVDGDQDGHIDFDEFKVALPLLSHWGLHLTEDNVATSFDEIDADHGGHVLFSELCDWAIDKRINLEDEAADEDDDAQNKQGETFETEVTEPSVNDEDVQQMIDTLRDFEGERPLDYSEEMQFDPEEQAKEIDKHILLVQTRLDQEHCLMGFWEFLRVLRHFGLYPAMISMHTARTNFADVCSASEQGVGGFPEFVESLCRICFMHLSVYGNCVQQTTTSKRKFLWIVTWLQSKCRARGISIDTPRAALVKSLDEWELHELILGGVMSRPLARGRLLGERRL